mgnify:CR=1 FL=1
MKVIYPVIFTETKDEKDVVLVYIPDLNGMTEGYGLQDAIEMAKDYVGNVLVDMAAIEIPKGSQIKDIDIKKSPFFEYGESFVSLVDVDVDYFRRTLKSKSVRRNITLPEWLDDMATKAKINVSAFVQEALKQKLGVA